MSPTSLHLAADLIVTPTAVIEGGTVLIEGGRIKTITPLSRESGRGAGGEGAMPGGSEPSDDRFSLKPTSPLSRDSGRGAGGHRIRRRRILEGATPPQPPASPPPLRGYLVMPGFIDLHTHGFGGHGFGDGSEAARQAARLLAAAGVTACYATLGQGSSIAAIARTLEGAAEVVDAETGGARIAGLALEGPFISVAKRGAWPPANLRQPDIAELRELIAASAGTLRRVNVAPELPGALDFIRFAREQDLIVSLGHSDATAEQARAGAQAGATITNHTFNGMSGLHHRAPGLAGETMANPALLAELILDGVHVHPVAAKALFAAKGGHGLAIITDNTTSAGLPDGTYGRDGREVTVRDGEVRLPDGTLAGSASPFDRNLRNAAAWLTDDLATLAAITSANAARALGIGDDTGAIIEGHRADLVLLDRDLQVQATIVGGEIVYQRTPVEVGA